MLILAKRPPAKRGAFLFDWVPSIWQFRIKGTNVDNLDYSIYFYAPTYIRVKQVPLWPQQLKLNYE
jgi:hypothetical protein